MTRVIHFYHLSLGRASFDLECTGINIRHSLNDKPAFEKLGHYEGLRKMRQRILDRNAQKAPSANGARSVFMCIFLVPSACCLMVLSSGLPRQHPATFGPTSKSSHLEQFLSEIHGSRFPGWLRVCTRGKSQNNAVYQAILWNNLVNSIQIQCDVCPVQVACGPGGSNKYDRFVSENLTVFAEGPRNGFLRISFGKAFVSEAFLPL